MARRWYNEDYRKLYTRQDGPWLSLPACARALASDLIRYADDKGVVAVVEPHETEAQALAGVVHAKADEAAWMERATSALMDDEYLVKRGRKLIIRNFVEAQERLSQAARRKRRQRDREAAEGGPDPGQGPDGGGTRAGQDRDQGRDGNGTTGVTNAGPVTPHVTPHVTPLSAVIDEIDEIKEPASSGAPARGSTHGRYILADLQADWWELLETPPGDATSLGELLKLVEQTAAARKLDTRAFARSLLPAAAATFADMKARGVHHGALTAGALVRLPLADPGRYFAQALALLDTPPPATVTPIRPSRPPPQAPQDDDPLFTPEELAAVEARRKASDERRAALAAEPPIDRARNPMPKRLA